MTKKYLLLFLLVLAIQSSISAQENEDIFTIYLVRHSEKDLTSSRPSDPPLTACGKERSVNLSNFLKDVPLDAVYSSNYSRTKNTALPTAKSKGLEITIYNPEELETFSKQLLKSKQDALVVGHSNTTGVLAGILVDEEIGEFNLDIYDRIYQVVIYNHSGRLHLLHLGIECNE
jgi:broad specificity phosphatase PhoE